MLEPDIRIVAVDLLTPPYGYVLEHAWITTYSLDLETLLALPLAMLSQKEDSLTSILENPLILTEAFRSLENRLHIFADRGAIALPQKHRDLYSILENCVHLVSAPGGGAFHPKVWLMHFSNPEGSRSEDIFRVSILSRNLTFDNSWDLALTTENIRQTEKIDYNQGLIELFQHLPNMTVSLPSKLTDLLTELCTKILPYVLFPSPEHFTTPIRFISFGTQGRTSEMWVPRKDASRLLAIAPFLTNHPGSTPLTWLQNIKNKDNHDIEKLLISRADQLNQLPAQLRDFWNKIFILSDLVEPEDTDDTRSTLSGLHAKALIIEHGYDVTWWVGSANLSTAAWIGQNVEIMAEMTARKSKCGIDHFLTPEFVQFCLEYEYSPLSKEKERLLEDEKKQTEIIRKIIEADLSITCTNTGKAWDWQLAGSISLPKNSSVTVWPITQESHKAQRLELPLSFVLPSKSVTAFVAFRIKLQNSLLPEANLVLKLPIFGAPLHRLDDIFSDLISTSDKLMNLLFALLGGFENFSYFEKQKKHGISSLATTHIHQQALLENLLKMASRAPEKLNPIRRVLHSLNKTEEGKKIIPKELWDTWTAIDTVLQKRK